MSLLFSSVCSVYCSEIKEQFYVHKHQNKLPGHLCFLNSSPGLVRVHNVKHEKFRRSPSCFRALNSIVILSLLSQYYCNGISTIAIVKITSVRTPITLPFFYFQFFMIMPMTILYALANITFQLAVKNSSPHTVNCTSCWDFTSQSSDHVKFFNAFKLMQWYYNPVLWAFLLSYCQAFSHVFERKWINEVWLF